MPEKRYTMNIPTMNIRLAVPIISAAVAAAVSIAIVFLGRRSETIKQVQAMRTAAYADFIRGIANLAIIQREPVQGREQLLKAWEAKMLVADAKARIAIYGSESVAASLAHFLRGGAVLDTAERARTFVGVCQEMRNEGRARKTAVADSDIHFLLFGLELNDYQ